MSLLALLAFAGNSVLCRLALSDGAIQPASFTAIRLLAGAITLAVLIWLFNLSKETKTRRSEVSRFPSSMLFAYAALFSFAYVTLDTGVGALILFGSVQITMVLINFSRGNRLNAFEWIGLALACAGLVYLVFPELTKPSVFGFMLMSLAGVSWGIYTVLGQGSSNPLADTGANFIRSVPLGVLLVLPFLDFAQLMQVPSSAFLEASLLAIASGAITSGIGYAIWYAALPNLSTSQAGVMQLLVPIIAAVGGVVFANEVLTTRLVFASVLTLGGILIVMAAKDAQSPIEK